MIPKGSDHQPRASRSLLAAVDGWLGAPFGGEAADGDIGGFVEVEEIADDAAVEEGAVGVGVGEVGGLELEGAELVEDGLGAA